MGAHGSAVWSLCLALAAPEVRKGVATVCGYRSNAAMRTLLSLSLAVASSLSLPSQEPPSWEQLDARPVPQWFQDAKFGIFIHWGVYAVPAFCDTSTYSEWYQHWVDTNAHNGLERQFHERVYGKDFAYRDFAPRFQAELFDPQQWASLFRRAGAKYIVITSKHHDGFCLWPNDKVNEVRGYPWNAMVTGPKRDLLGELSAAVRKEGVKFGLYYSFLEWHNPLFAKSIPDYVEQQMFPQVQELIARYQPAVFWPDGEWEHPDTTWRSRELLHWIRTHAKNPDEIVVNDRWGKSERGERGDFYTTEYGGYGGSKTFLGQKPFEECRGIGHSFAFNRAENHDIYLSRTECVHTLIDLVSRGGNLLLDIGPAADGTIPVIMQDRLLAMGRWLERNGEAIYSCSRSPFRRTPWGRATQNGSMLYLHVYDWPQGDRLMVPGLASNVQQAWLLSDAARTPLPLQRSGQGVLALDLRGHHPDEHATVIALRLDGALRIDERFLPDADGSVTLAASTAALSGPGLRLEPKGNLGYWTSLDAKATWSHVVVPSDAAYWVDVEYSLAPGEEGGEMEVSIGGAEFSVPLLKPTKGWQDYRSERVLTDPRQLGLTRYGNGATGDAHVHDLKPVTLTPKVGETATVDVVVRAAKLGKSALCNLRSLRLVRTEPVASAASSPSLDRAAIERVSAQWCERMRAKNASDVAACYLTDAILHRVGDAPIAGRAAIESHLSTLVPRVVAIDVETHDLRGGGDVVVQLGQEVRTLRRNEAAKDAAAALDVQRIDFVRTWRRIGDRDWQLQSDVGWPVK